MKIDIERTPIDGVTVVVPGCFRDARGFFSEVFRQDQFDELGLPSRFVQFNHSRSAKGVLRGLHFQWAPPMGKLMRVVQGAAFLVAVDLRKRSPTLGRWFGLVATAENRKQVFASGSFARGFCVLSDFAEIEYLCTGVYNAGAESAVLWNDPAIGIEWPIQTPILSDKDSRAQTLAEWLDRPESELLPYPEAPGP